MKNMCRLITISCAPVILFILLTCTPVATSGEQANRYIFSWPFIDTSGMSPRGGTTQGPDVEVASGPGDRWQALTEPGLDKKERDRRAILAMAGPYRASFDFLETVVFSGELRPDRPYRSWGTEYIYVVANRPDFISLQHIMVMVFNHEDGSSSDPVVIKHWRQDWRYEDRSLHVYSGSDTWEEQQLEKQTVEGKWSQAVYQVDDSPRYEAVGEWLHSDHYSIWQSEQTWRPLPRREFSVRDDYDVLIGTNRHTIIPNGWVHEEDNLKVRLDQQRTADSTVAREYGVNRYERINNYDWSAGDDYWERTEPFWREVREAWSDIYRDNEQFRLRRKTNGDLLFVKMFQLAESSTATTFNRRSARAEIDAVLGDFIIRTGGHVETE